MEKKQYSEPFNKIRWGQAMNTVLNRHLLNEDTKSEIFAMCLVRYKQLEDLEYQAELVIKKERQDSVDELVQKQEVLKL